MNESDMSIHFLKFRFIKKKIKFTNYIFSTLFLLNDLRFKYCCRAGIANNITPLTPIAEPDKKNPGSYDSKISYIQPKKNK